MRTTLLLVVAIALLVPVLAASDEAAPEVAGPGNPVVLLENPGRNTDDWLIAPSGKARVMPMAHGKNAFVAMLSIDQGAEVPVHRDETEEYILIVDGGGTLTMDGTSYSLEEGSMVYMHAGAEVSFVAGDDTMALQVFAGPGPAKKYDTWKPTPQAERRVKDALQLADTLRTAEKAYHAEWDAFTTVSSCPPGKPGAEPRDWAGACTESFSMLGWWPDGDTYCSLSVEAINGNSAATEAFKVRVLCDFDGDGVPMIIEADRAEKASVTSPPDVR